MSLAEIAVQQQRDREAQEREQCREYDDRQLVAAQTMVRELAGEYAVTFLNCVGVSDPVRNKVTGDLRYTSRCNGRRVHRFQVDDVVVRVWKHWHGGHQEWSVEVSCHRCGAHTSPREAAEYDWSHGSLVEAVGEALAKDWTCKWCELEAPSNCPTCGRRVR